MNEDKAYVIFYNEPFSDQDDAIAVCLSKEKAIEKIAAVVNENPNVGVYGQWIIAQNGLSARVGVYYKTWAEEVSILK